MLFASFSSPPTAQDCEGIDGAELRLDLFDYWDIACVKSLLSQLPVPVMLTIRNGTDEQIRALLELKPPFFDLDVSVRFPIDNYPETKFILSYHNFSKTPPDLESIYISMKNRRAFVYKIACFVHSTNDALRMLLFSKKHADVSAICMGEKGEWARVLGPVVGNVIDYAYVGQKTASGQLSVSEMVNVYRYRTLRPNTPLYGLIGGRVDQSQGHLYHNRGDMVYVKMCVQKEDLGVFFPLAEELGFRGLSVTMPLKEAVIPFLNSASESVNTIDLIQKVGISTDGQGALQVLGAVKNKVILILGAGGAAKAIAREATLRGAKVWIHNRTFRDLEYAIGIPQHYDIVINCTPMGDESVLKPGCRVLDIVYVPKETHFLKKAKELGCQIAYGEEMFFNQAALQREFWGCDRPRDFEHDANSRESVCHCRPSSCGKISDSLPFPDSNSQS